MTPKYKRTKRPRKIYTMESTELLLDNGLFLKYLTEIKVGQKQSQSLYTYSSNHLNNKLWKKK